MPHTLVNSKNVALFLVENRYLLPPKGRALDIAMGSGYNAVYLAREGFHVDGVDIDRHRIASAVKLASSQGVTINAILTDLENFTFTIPERHYDVIICFYYLQRSLFSPIIDGLLPGGTVIYETFLIDQAKVGRPKNPEHLLEHNELLHHFQKMRILRYREGYIAPDKAIASIVAVK